MPPPAENVPGVSLIVLDRGSASQSVGPAAALPGNLLEMCILGLHPCPTESEPLGDGAGKSTFLTSPWGILMSALCENHCFRIQS